MNRTQALAEISRICKFKHYALSTEDTYLHWTGRFFRWLAQHHTEVSDEPSARMEGFLSDLARQDVSASTQNQAFSAILFFYRNVMKQEPGNVNALRAKKSEFLRHAPQKSEVRRLLEEVQDSQNYPLRLIIFLIYACGTRVGEPIALRNRDIDWEKQRMILRQAKGAKDRMVPIPDCLMDKLAEQRAASKLVWERAMQRKIPVKLPHQLGKKYSQAGSEFSWFWLFPLATPSKDRRTGEMVWWHCLAGSVQDEMRAASKRAKLDGSIKPHDLRHSWATHSHDDGASIRDIQEILGHKDLNTTMIYVHTEIERVESPLQRLGVAI